MKRSWQEQIERALTLPDYDWMAARVAMSVGNRNWQRLPSQPGQPRIGAVLCLMYPDDEQSDTLRVVLTKRPETLKNHAGQVSFPGGRVEENESFDAAALRELEEEIGVPPDEIELFGALPPLYIMPSDFLVHPFVGFTAERPTFSPDPAEVALIIEPTLTHLATPSTRKMSQRIVKNRTFDVPYFDVDGEMVWGATAMLLSDWIGRWQAVRID